ncbi:MAG: glutathione S-transferase family protein [Alphaproteobacteria bacterium]|nr:glutathione S-transferase family protein [Alphaproteobacteria bacterium]
MTTLTLYAAPTSGNCHKAARMLTLCELPATYRFVDLAAGAQHDPAFRQVSPFGEIPALVDADKAIANSPMILKHLAARTGRFGAESPEEATRIENWLYFDQQRIFSGLAMKRFLIRFAPNRAKPDVMSFLTAQGERALRELDRGLGALPFLAGAKPTIADIACSAYVLLAEEADFDLDRWEAVSAWLDRLRALPNWKPPYDLLPKADGPI